MFKNGRWKHVGDRVGRSEAVAMAGRADDVMAGLMADVIEDVMIGLITHYKNKDYYYYYC